MSKNYLIKLTPLDWFFFGGERTHGEGKKSDYLSKSNSFPQQTAVLGMVRYQLLKQKGCLTLPGAVINKRPSWLISKGEVKTAEHINAINDLVGAQSFYMSNDNTQVVNFGAIKSISPITVAKIDKTEEYGLSFLSAAPLSHGYIDEFMDIDAISLNRKCSENRIMDDQKSFDHKLYDNYLKWKSKNGIIPLDDIWRSKTKIGITKLKAGEVDDEKNFYKQEYLSLKKDYIYAFFVSLDFELQPDKVFIGGQRSAFDMAVVPLDKAESCQELFKKACGVEKTEGKIVLLNDAYVPDMKSLNDLCLFHWSYSVPFRNIETTTAKNNYAVKPKKSSIKYNFLQKGSVLYFDESKRAKIEEILNNQNLQTIGYNIFI